MLRIIPLLLLITIGLSSCGGKSKTWQKNPVDELVKEMTAVPKFSIILHDMDVEGNFSKTYKHQYQIIKEKDTSNITEELTGWYQVPEDFFWLHENNMGMEITAKTEDGLSKTAAPPGYNNYVGNERYGRWNNSGGSSFWQFYGQYAFMSSMFGLMTRPAYYGHYNDYYGNYRGRRAYYGPTSSTGNRRYGTNSDYNRKKNPNFFSRRSTKKGWSRSSSSRRNSNSTSRSTRRSRSSGRYSSSRGRGGGFGK